MKMIPVVCFCSFLFGNWSLIWNNKSGRYEMSNCFIFVAIVMFGNNCFVLNSLLNFDDSLIHMSPQYLILISNYVNIGILFIDRFFNTGRSAYFANELYGACGRTVESGRHLLDFVARIFASTLLALMFHYRFGSFSNIPALTLNVQTSVTAFAFSIMECQYVSACHAIADEFDAVNKRTDDAAVAESFAAATADHCRLVRLVRLFNGEYAVPLMLTTFNLLLGQVYMMNDVVSLVVEGGTLESSYADVSLVIDWILWSWFWLRFWWICYRVDCLITSVHSTAKIMVAKDINSYPDHTKKLALEFLDQLLHRHVRISAWGFYDVNKELLFMTLGYQIGLCLICNQFSTGLTFMDNITTIQTNYTFTTVIADT